MPVKTTCPYCGVGCGVVADRDAAGTVTVRGDPLHPANFGRLCAKGSALAETIGLEGRLLAPVVNGQETSWDAALDHVADGFGKIVREHGPDSVAFYVSGQILTEDYYVINKLAKGFIGTANIDTNSRLCMASSVAGHKRAFGSDTVPGCYEDLEAADLLVLVGSNAAWCHPILYQRMVAAKAQQPGLPHRRHRSAADRDMRRRRSAPAASLGQRFGAVQRVARASCVVQCHRRRVRGRIHHRRRSRAAAGRRPDGAQTADICGLAEGAVALFFDWFAKTERVVTLYSQGINQSSSGVDKVNAIINCHLVDRPYRAARHGAVLADRTAQRDGRPGSRRARQSIGRPHGDREPEAPRHRPALLAVASHRGQGRASRPSTCSRRSPTGASRRSGSCAPIRWSACRTPIACAARSMRASSSSSPIACAIPTPRVMPTYCCRR